MLATLADVDRLAPVLAAMRAARGWDLPGQPGPRVHLGTCRWSARRRAPVDHRSTLFGFFRALADRERACREPEDATDALVREAWAAFLEGGFRIRPRRLALRGRTATGGAVAAVWEELFSRGPLADYERLAAAEWLVALERQPVRPGPAGIALIGHGYRETDGEGLAVELRRAQYRFAVSATEPAFATRVGDVATAPRALAAVAIAEVHRPGFGLAALWQVLRGQRSSREDVRAELAAIALGLRRAFVARKLTAKDAPWTRADVAPADAEVHAAWERLQRLVWPAGRTLAGDDLDLLPARVLELCERDEGARYRERGRFDVLPPR